MANELKSALEKFANDLAKKLEAFVKDVSELEVRTYTTPADQMSFLVQAAPDFGEIATEGKVSLRAYTKVAFDGDTTVCVPTDASGSVDTALWSLHQAMVDRAIENRAKMLKTMGDAAAAALRALKESET